MLLSFMDLLMPTGARSAPLRAVRSLRLQATYNILPDLEIRVGPYVLILNNTIDFNLNFQDNG